MTEWSDTGELRAQCPACFEWVELDVDPNDRGSMVQDCDVCCRPMEVTVHWSGSDGPWVSVRAAY
ncbi:MAG: CPXCG motif-containing cysteine-rich protein [Myxococcota bacterium]|nr:CPXCG motif-containing cysteine-rich protein [Myxococcota bacterium]MEC9388694.1 CPXCG motif-containing cysteine-rich protein [Myxococcota bacterium]